MTNVNPETNEKSPAAGLPLRGLAMVLIAVAVALGLWALYSFTRGGNPEPTAADAPVAAQSPQAQQPQPGQAQPSDAPANGQSATPAEGQGETGADGAATPGAPAPAGEGDAAVSADGAGEGASASQRKVSILNNSTVQGLAADVSKQVTDAGYELGEVGNFADEILTETTVFFPAGDAVAEAQARTLADKFSGVAKENIQALPEKAMAEGAVTIVLVNQ
ncbi:LytR C-terminal domain-containing protein [Corynebacterium phoceense]|uniref:LytR C-terminal domain-containing protein n=1 Tax=Corynebacterium phoceense TaxID=1686286 RepID=UPI00211C5DC0|nr:LytR C-terminal domain-containing protein [Corynebacterium phoceense]